MAWYLCLCVCLRPLHPVSNEKCTVVAEIWVSFLMFVPRVFPTDQEEFSKNNKTKNVFETFELLFYFCSDKINENVFISLTRNA